MLAARQTACTHLKCESGRLRRALASYQAFDLPDDPGKRASMQLVPAHLVNPPQHGGTRGGDRGSFNHP